MMEYGYDFYDMAFDLEDDKIREYKKMLNQ